MKNVLSTLVLIAVLGLIGFGVYQYSLRSDAERKKQPLNDRSEIAGMLSAEKQREVWRLEHMAFQIEHQLGKPFAQAWADHDLEGVTQFLDGDFDSFIPVESQWKISTQGLVEEKIRVTGEQQGVDKDSDAFFSLIFDPILGVKIEDAQFRVLEIEELTATDWFCKVRLSGGGVDDTGQYRAYQNDANISLRFKDKQTLGDSAPLRSWATTTEIVRTCPQQLMAETTEALGRSSPTSISNGRRRLRSRWRL